ncbi:MAG TPA: hypothetical protein ENJ04_05485 [Nitrospirae bacterium]|nr:hypothetical protein [Nitrospirota bacterium]
MTAPLYGYGMFGPDTGLVLAVVIGFFFGLFLERGGLGDPHKLTGVFYLRDFTVPKIMFTAILVAATGLYLLSDLNLLDMKRVWVVPTYFWPQIVGGAVFGAGFVLSGYCPGTAVAGLATGRLDALVVMAGIAAGSLLFAVLYPYVEGFYSSSAMGLATWQGLLGVNHWIVIAALSAAAAAMFYFMERFESRDR